MPALSLGRLPQYREALAPLVRTFWAPAVLGAILLLAAVVRIYDIGGNPPGFFADEASFGYNAYTILHTGKDEHGETLPLLFRSFGEYKLPVYIYSQVPFIAVLGLTELAVRLTSATYGILTVLAVYLLVRALFQQQAPALTAAAVLAILPWHIHYSRTGLGDIIVHPFFLILGLYLFVVGTRRPVFWLAAGAAFVLALFSYRAAWVLTPPLLLVLAVLYHRELIKQWPFALAGLLIVAVAGFAIVMHLLSVDTDRGQEQSILSLDLSTQETIKRFFSHYRSHFEASFLFDGTAERNPRHVLAGFGWLYRWQVPFIVLGGLALLWKPSRPKLLVLALLVLFPLATAVSKGSPGSNRALIGSMAFAIITAYGIVTAARVLSGWRRPPGLKVVGVGLAGIVVLGTTITASVRFASYLDAYHGRYQQTSAGYWGWQWGPGQIIEQFVAVEHEYDQLVMDGNFNAPHIFFRFYAPNGCENCIIGNSDKYDPTKKQLFALRPENLWLTHEYDVKGTLQYPDGSVAFVFAEITGGASGSRGTLGQIPMEEAGVPIAELDRAIEQSPEEAALYYARGNAYGTLGDYEQAARDYSKAIELDPRLAEAYTSRGNAYWELARIGRAMRDYREAAQVNPSLPLAYYNWGNGNAAQGDYHRAVGNYRKAIDLDPTLVEAYNNLAHAYRMLGSYDEAIGALNTAIELDPGLALAYANRGFAYGKQGDVEQALVDLDRAIELDPDLALAYAVRGSVYRDLGDLAQAIADFDRALKLDPGYAEVYSSRASANSELGEHLLAVADLDRAIELDRDFALAYARRGIAYLKVGESGRAIADLDKAVELDRAYASAPSQRRNAAWNLGDVGPAIADLEQAASLASDPNVLAQLEGIIAYLVAR